MQKITFEDATLLTQAKVTIDGTDYDVVDSTYSGGTDLNSDTFNTMQDNIENSIDENTTNIATNTTNIGTLSNLNTTDKTSCVNAINEVNNNWKGTILWTNPNPDNVINLNYEINLSNDDYKNIEVIFKRTNAQNIIYSTGKLPKGYNISLDCFSTSSDNYSWLRSRLLNRISDTLYKSGQANIQFTNQSAFTVENGACIPIEIIGYK